MVEIQIPKDVREFQPKFIGPFTQRQVVCLLGAVGVGFLVIQAEKLLGFGTTSYLPAIVPAMIPIFFGWGEQILHMKPEVYIRTVFKNQFIVPKYRPYKTHNLVEIEIKKIEREEGLDKKEGKPVKKKRKKRAKGEALPEELVAYK